MSGRRAKAIRRLCVAAVEQFEATGSPISLRVARIGYRARGEFPGLMRAYRPPRLTALSPAGHRRPPEFFAAREATRHLSPPITWREWCDLTGVES